ncbi:hypothetical protein [Anaerotignum sp.]
MKRLTMDNLDQMGMYDLAHNCCYASEGKARYRDFETDIDAREFARNLMVAYGKWKSCEEHGLDADNEMVDDEIFDGAMLDNLMYEPTEIEGLIALFYRNLWGMADLREVLKYYEDADERRNLLYSLPCAIGDTVYTNTAMQGWYLRKENRPYEAKVVFIGINGVDNFMNVEFEGGQMLQFNFSRIGKEVFLTREEAEAALEEMNHE